MSKPTIKSMTGKVTWSDGSTHTFRIMNVSGQWSWQQGGDELTRQQLGEREFGDVLDKLAAAVGEHVAEHTPTTHWHVGSNIEGYMPDGEVACFDDPEEAKQYLDSEMSTVQDSLPECADAADNGDPCGECDSCKAHKQLEDNRAELRHADVTEGIRLTYNDGRTLDIAQWVERVHAGDCDIDHD